MCSTYLCTQSGGGGDGMDGQSLKLRPATTGYRGRLPATGGQSLGHRVSFQIGPSPRVSTLEVGGGVDFHIRRHNNKLLWII
jgi:hypothetical protein